MKVKLTYKPCPATPTPSVYAGYYRIGDLAGAMQVMLPTKPKWLHRKFTQLLLGWEWIDTAKD